MATDTPKVALPGGVVQGEAPGTWHALWNQICANVEARLAKGGSADPNVAEQGHYVGQYYARSGAEADLYVCSIVGSPGTWISFRHHPALFQAVVRLKYRTLTSAAGVIAPDFSLGNFFSTTLTENTTIQNPTNVSDGGIYAVQVTQDAGTLRTLAWGGKFIFPAGTPNTIALGVRKLFFFVCASNGDLICWTLPESLSLVEAEIAAELTVTTTEVAIAEFANLAPIGADGVKKFRIVLDMTLRGTGTADAIIRLRKGTTGTIADTEIRYFRASVANAQYLQFAANHLDVPGATDKYTVSVQGSTAGVRVAGPNTGFSTNQKARLYIEEIR